MFHPISPSYTRPLTEVTGAWMGGLSMLELLREPSMCDGACNMFPLSLLASSVKLIISLQALSLHLYELCRE